MEEIIEEIENAKKVIAENTASTINGCSRILEVMLTDGYDYFESWYKTEVTDAIANMQNVSALMDRITKLKNKIDRQ